MAYVDELIANGMVCSMNDKCTIITDRMGTWREQNVVLVWEGCCDGKMVSLTPDEVEVLLTHELTSNVYRSCNGSLGMAYIFDDFRSFQRAIVCGIMAPSTKANMRSEIFEYAKKMGYVTDTMIPVKMASGTKSLIFNDDGTYSVSYSWHESVLKKVERRILDEFTKHFFSQHAVQVSEGGVLMLNLSEDEVFSRRNIDLFREYDIQIHYLSREYDKELLLFALIRRAFASIPENTFGRGEFENLGTIEIPEDRHAALAFTEHADLNMRCGSLYHRNKFKEYLYEVTIPNSEAVQKILTDTEKFLKAKFNNMVSAKPAVSGNGISVFYSSDSIISELERELICLDYALELLKAEERFDGYQLHESIISLLGADSTERYREAYRGYMGLAKHALPEKYNRFRKFSFRPLRIIE